MTVPAVNVVRLAELHALALRLGVAALPAHLRGAGIRGGVEMVTLEAMAGIRADQSGSMFAAVADPAHGRSVPLLHRYADAADLLDVSVPTVKRLVASGDLKAIDVAGTRRIPHDELVAFVGRALAAA